MSKRVEHAAEGIGDTLCGRSHLKGRYTVRAWRGSDVATVGDFNVASRETALEQAKAAAAGA